jgi:hypothetical protein
MKEAHMGERPLGFEVANGTLVLRPRPWFGVVQLLLLVAGGWGWLSVAAFQPTDLLFLLPWLLLSYRTLVSVLNRIEVTVRAGEVAVHSVPLPWVVPVRLRRADIEQVFSIDLTSRGRRATRRFAVKALLTGGEECTLLDELPTSALARTLRDELSAKLGLAADDGRPPFKAPPGGLMDWTDPR